MKGEWTTVAIKRALIDEIERFLLTQTARDAGLTSAPQFVDLAIRMMIRRIELMRFELIHAYEGHVSILDSKVKPLGAIAHVYLREVNMWCDLCDEHLCVHMQYMWEVPEVRRMLQERGFEPAPPIYALPTAMGASVDPVQVMRAAAEDVKAANTFSPAPDGKSG